MKDRTVVRRATPEWVAECRLRLCVELDKALAGRGALLVSDLDGTMAPFVVDPRAALVEPSVKKAYRELGKLGVMVVVVTGGDAERTIEVLTRSGLQVPAKATYGSQLVVWGDASAMVEYHPRSGEASLVLQVVKGKVEQEIRKGLGVTGSVLFTDASEAERAGLVLVEDKGTVLAFHPKGRGASSVLDLIKCAVDVAVAEVGDKVSVHLNNGTVEVVYDLGVDKGTALLDLYDEYLPELVICNVDDAGDIPMLQAVSELRGRGVKVFVAAVHNPPRPEEGRVGTPLVVLREADVVFNSPKEMGEFYLSLSY